MGRSLAEDSQSYGWIVSHAFGFRVVGDVTDENRSLPVVEVGVETAEDRVGTRGAPEKRCQLSPELDAGEAVEVEVDGVVDEDEHDVEVLGGTIPSHLLPVRLAQLDEDGGEDAEEECEGDTQAHGGGLIEGPVALLRSGLCNVVSVVVARNRRATGDAWAGEARRRSASVRLGTRLGGLEEVVYDGSVEDDDGDERNDADAHEGDPRSDLLLEVVVLLHLAAHRLPVLTSGPEEVEILASAQQRHHRHRHHCFPRLTKKFFLERKAHGNKAVEGEGHHDPDGNVTRGVVDEAVRATQPHHVVDLEP